MLRFLYVLLLLKVFLHPTSSAFLNTSLYRDHCSSTVPLSTPTSRRSSKSLLRFQTPLFTGGDRLVGKPWNKTIHYPDKFIHLNFGFLYETVEDSIFKTDAVLNINSPRSNIKRQRHNRGAFDVIEFRLTGFWSDISRQLCMVGSTYFWDDRQGKTLNPEVVLKLRYDDNSDNTTIDTFLIAGILEGITTSVDGRASGFEPISFYSFHNTVGYKYSLVSRDVAGEFSNNSEVFSSDERSVTPMYSVFYSLLSRRSILLDLEYSEGCFRSKHCSPISRDHDGLLPRFLSLDMFIISELDRKLTYVLKFQHTNENDQDFDVGSTLIGEASWDDTNNQLYVVACRLANLSVHFGNPIEDCSIRLKLTYPLVWTIKNDAKISGQLWTNKTVDELGYFDKINFTSPYENHKVAVPGLRYEYTATNTVKKLCRLKIRSSNVKKYPDVSSPNMRFDMFVGFKDKPFANGYASPISLGNELYGGDGEKDEFRPGDPLNISYRLSFSYFPEVNNSKLFPVPSESLQGRHVQITAEGVYIEENGHLCMVGCRKLMSQADHNPMNTSAHDCEILVNIEFAPLYEKRGGFVKGTIRSTRSKSDHLYFEVLTVFSAAFYTDNAEESIQRMGIEIAMVLISNTLSCVFLVLQLLYVRKNANSLSGISSIMLLILALGHTIPLVSNIETSSSPNIGEWLETNQVTVRVIHLVASLLQIRLIQLVWNAKTSQAKDRDSWAREEKAFIVSLVMYASGSFLTLLLSWIKNRHGLWACLRLFAGLVLDGFLMPQITLNFFRDSTEKALSEWFYIGNSVIRLAPRVYDLYRMNNYPTAHIDRTYYYANTTEDVHSSAWDVMTVCGIMAFAVIVFLQQKKCSN